MAEFIGALKDATGKVIAWPVVGSYEVIVGEAKRVGHPLKGTYAMVPGELNRIDGWFHWEATERNVFLEVGDRVVISIAGFVDVQAVVQEVGRRIEFTSSGCPFPAMAGPLQAERDNLARRIERALAELGQSNFSYLSVGLGRLGASSVEAFDVTHAAVEALKRITAARDILVNDEPSGSPPESVLVDIIARAAHAVGTSNSEDLQQILAVLKKQGLAEYYDALWKAEAALRAARAILAEAEPEATDG
jgi:hypothetical protein